MKYWRGPSSTVGSSESDNISDLGVSFPLTPYGTADSSPAGWIRAVWWESSSGTASRRPRAEAVILCRRLHSCLRNPPCSTLHSISVRELSEKWRDLVEMKEKLVSFNSPSVVYAEFTLVFTSRWSYKYFKAITMLCDLAWLLPICRLYDRVKSHYVGKWAAWSMPFLFFLVYFVVFFTCIKSKLTISRLSWFEMVSFMPFSPHVEIHLHLLSGVNEVFARLVLNLFEDSRPDVMCVQRAALRFFFLK